MANEKDTSTNNAKLISWLSLGLSLLAIVISVWRITLSHAPIDNKKLAFSYDALGTIIGIVLSAVALVVSLYFIIIGIRADSVRTGIKEDARMAEKTIKTIRDNATKEAQGAVDSISSKATEEANKVVENISKEAKNICDDIEKESKENKVVFITTIYELYSEVIGMTQEFFNSINRIDNGFTLEQKNEIEKRVKKLKIDQSRFACNIRNLDIEEEEKIKEVIMRGTSLVWDLSTDEDDLRLLEEIKNKSKDQDIRDAAQFAYNELEKKVHPDTFVQGV